MQPRKPSTLEISQECLLCYDQSQQRSGHANWPQNHKVIKVLACSLVSSRLIGFQQDNNIPEILLVFTVFLVSLQVLPSPGAFLRHMSKFEVVLGKNQIPKRLEFSRQKTRLKVE